MSEIEEIARDLVALWQSPVIQGLSRADRNAAIEDTRNALIKACATVAQPAEQRLCKATVGGSSPPGGTTLPESAPAVPCSLPSGESDPSVMLDSAGADTVLITDEMVELGAKALCLDIFGDKIIHGEARCCQAGGGDGCCIEEVRHHARACLAAALTSGTRT
jgi:hypothetical protein